MTIEVDCAGVFPKNSFMPDYGQRASDVIANADAYHHAYYEVKTFGGPSLYFHRKSLEAGAATDFTRRLEYVYATLTAWGMHRMGRGGSKMLPFDEFQTSMMPLQDRIREAARLQPPDMTDEDWANIEAIFKGIRVMASGTSIVGNSKVLAHLIPNIVPPIDREYTLRFLRGHTNIANGLDEEWSLMKELIAQFFIPVSSETAFQAKAKAWLSDQTRYPWDTSVLKIIDNLIIGRGKLQAPRKAKTIRPSD